MTEKSKQALDGPIVHVEKNVAIYKILGSPYYRARIWRPHEKKRIVRSTKSTSRIEAMKAAREFAAEISSVNHAPKVDPKLTFEHFADKCFKQQNELVAKGLRHPQQQKNDKYRLYDPEIGLAKYFKQTDIRTISTKSYLDYIAFVKRTKPTIAASSTFNHLASCFRKVLKIALQDGIVNQIPETPREERKETPRSYFKFYPLVPHDQDEYKLILETAQKLGEENSPNGDIPVSNELYEFILWQTPHVHAPDYFRSLWSSVQRCHCCERPKSQTKTSIDTYSWKDRVPNSRINARRCHCVHKVTEANPKSRRFHLHASCEKSH